MQTYNVNEKKSDDLAVLLTPTAILLSKLRALTALFGEVTQDLQKLEWTRYGRSDLFNDS